MKKIFTKNVLVTILIIIMGVVCYGTTLRGQFGNPGPDVIKGNLDQQTKSLELSPERGRYAQVYALATDHTYTLSKTWALVVYPDVGVIGGKFYSFFAPGVSYLALPFYIVGAKFGLGQVATFGFISIITIINLLLIYIIGKNILKLSLGSNLFSVLVFGFASTAWSYAITLYQHQVSVCLLLLSIYAVWKFKHSTTFAWVWAGIVGFAYGLGVFVDYPNAIMLIWPVFYLLISMVSIKEISKAYSITIRYAGFTALVTCLLITSFQFWHNAHYFGGWKNLAGGLPSYQPETVTTLNTGTTTNVSTISASTSAQIAADQEQHVSKDVVGFFKEQYLLNDLNVLFLSSNRGLFFFSPIFLIALIGIFFAFRAFSIEYGILLLSSATNILLYSSWGDPWGGWAYGPRYLILSMAVLALFVGLAIDKFSKGNIYIRIATFLLYAYSAFVALVGALTTNAIPQTSEAELLPIKLHNFLLNLQFMSLGESGSFVYNSYIYSYLTLAQYFLVIYSIVLVAGVVTLFIIPLFENKNTPHE